MDGRKDEHSTLYVKEEKEVQEYKKEELKT